MLRRYPLVLSAVIASPADHTPHPRFGALLLWEFLGPDRSLAISIGPDRGWFSAAREHRLLAVEALRVLKSEFSADAIAQQLQIAVPRSTGRVVIASDSPHVWLEGRHPGTPWVWHFPDVFRVLDAEPQGADTPPPSTSTPPAGTQQGGGDDPRATKKRSTERGEGRCKLIAALIEHHKYDNGSCLNPAPIGNNELAKVAEVSTSTASTFFNEQFKGHTRYKAICRDIGKLVHSLKLLSGEFSPHDLYGSEPPEKRRDGRRSRQESTDD